MNEGLSIRSLTGENIKPIATIVKESEKVLIKFKEKEKRLISQGKINTFIIKDLEVQTTFKLEDSHTIEYITTNNTKYKLEDVKPKDFTRVAEVFTSDDN
jgi:predicted type IV restriction endonuclease